MCSPASRRAPPPPSLGSRRSRRIIKKNEKKQKNKNVIRTVLSFSAANHREGRLLGRRKTAGTATVRECRLQLQEDTSE
ncbi:unnamed protein product [Cuscuta campestris]|uniref:Uncharacterized protein n=1 Tax=Cuscuta campestris TaxID=132261 RepID=A0A484NG84_9ASTE|nr:unnamed protein product [Cuscuta campestris]